MTADTPARGLIFDMDGTVVDNMRYHEAAWGRLLTEHGLPFDADAFYRATAGKASSEILAPLFPKADAAEIDALGHAKELYYRDAYGPHVAAVDGFMALIGRADAAGIPVALATAAPPGNVDIVLDTLGIRERFVTVVAPSQGFPGKPAPDLFLEAARRMNVAAADCIVFEDAFNGIEAAKRAGMRAVAVLTMLDAHEFDGFDNVIAAVKSFDELDGLPALQFG